MPVVVDASAVVELLIRSAAAATVESALVSDDAFAPELLDVEVMAALARLERAGRLTGEQATAAVHALAGAPIARAPHAPLRAGAWSRRANLSLYDATYVALASRLGCSLLTADGRLARATGLDVPVVLVLPPGR